ncbi:MAG: TonB-dependent receptor [Bacteroidales bacterium]|jgi:outer membrane receptor protein involved in Fe transport|nr:TonB-dependent receptor [Bacteroidales bacterium]
MLKKYFLLALSSGFAGLLQAQQSEDGIQPITLEEVVVSFSKETSRHKDIPASITLLSGKQLEQDGIRSLKNISTGVPNVFIPDYGSKLYAPIWVRGNGTRSSKSAQSVGLYVDGIPYPETAAFDFEFYDIENIEVLRGPQGTLYGRNAMAGIISVTTRSPLNRRGTDISLSGGNYGDGNFTLSHYAKAGKKLGVAAVANYNRMGGYFTNQHTGKKADERNDFSGRLRFTLQHNKNALSDFHAAYEHSRQEGYAYSLYDPETGTTDSVNYDEPSSYTRDLLSAGYHFTQQTRWGSIRTITGAQYLKDRQAVDQDFSPLPKYYAVQPQTQTMLSQEVLARSDFSRNYRWITGFFAFYQRRDKYVEVTIPAMNAQYQISDRQPVFSAAIYHQSSYNNLLVEGLSLTAGARIDREYVRQRYVSDVVLPSSTRHEANTDLMLDFFEFLPKVALRYGFLQQAVYVSIAKGYKTGGFNTSFREGMDEQTYDPETSWNYEAGLQLDLPLATTIQAAVFLIRWKDQQITQIVHLDNGNDDSVIHNAGQSESKGAELSLSSQPVGNLSLNASFGCTDARFRQYVVSDTLNYNGQRVPWSPASTFSGSISYRIPLKSFLNDMIFRVGYNRTGKIYWHEDNRAVQQPYHLLNGSVSMGKGPVTLTLWAKNILQTDYFVYYLNEPAIGVLVQKGRPFTFGVDVKIAIVR